MILNTTTTKDNYLKGNKIIRTYERVLLTVDKEKDLEDAVKEYTANGWKLGFYDNKELKCGFEIEFKGLEKYKTTKEPPITKERFYIAWEALLDIANNICYGKEMVDRAKQAIAQITKH